MSGEVSKPVMIGVIVVALGAVGALGWHFLGKGSQAQATAQPAVPSFMEKGPDGAYRPKGALGGSSPGAPMTGRPRGSGGMGGNMRPPGR